MLAPKERYDSKMSSNLLYTSSRPKQLKQQIVPVSINTAYRSTLSKCFCPPGPCKEWCPNFRTISENITKVLMEKGNWFIEQNSNQTNVRITHRCMSHRVFWKLTMIDNGDESALITDHKLIDNKCRYCVEEVPEELLTVYNLHNLGTRWP